MLPRFLALSLFLCLVPTMLLAQTPPKAKPEPHPVALQLWVRGQQHLRDGEMKEGIECFEESLAKDPNFTRNYLSLAAAYAELGEESRACLHLTLYVAAHPEHLAVRAQYAEMLHRLENYGQAREEYERFVADAQEVRNLPVEHLIHSHSRLMEIAEARSDDYEEHLHRGIGLYLLAKERAKLTNQEGGEMNANGLLCRAAAELTLARRSKPQEARPCWYLYEVWTQLSQQQPAASNLRAAEEAMLFGYLTPSEKRGLYLATRQRESRRR